MRSRFARAVIVARPSRSRSEDPSFGSTVFPRLIPRDLGRRFHASETRTSSDRDCLPNATGSGRSLARSHSDSYIVILRQRETQREREREREGEREKEREERRRRVERRHGTADEQRVTGARPGVQKPTGGARRRLPRQAGQRGQHVRVGSRDLRTARHSLPGRIFQGTPLYPLGAVYGVHMCARVYLRESRPSISSATTTTPIWCWLRVFIRASSPSWLCCACPRLSTSRPVFPTPVRGRV